jgi:protein arginine N-methyltransferase 1
VVLADPKAIKFYDMMTCTIEDSKGVFYSDKDARFDFLIDGNKNEGPISGIAGWFTSDFKTRTDEGGKNAPKINHPSFLSTGPDSGYTHWGQQVFYLPSNIPLLKGQTTRLKGTIEMTRTKENARLYNCRMKFESSRFNHDDPNSLPLSKSGLVEHVWMIP